MTVERFDACVVGHVVWDRNTIDGVALPPRPGGTAYYAALVYARLGLSTAVVTRVAAGDEEDLLGELRAAGVAVFNEPTPTTTNFHNIYPGADPDRRVQRADHVAAAIDASAVPAIEAGVVHLGPLLRTDLGPGIVELCRRLGGTVAMDVQGLTRTVVDGRVLACHDPARDALWAGIPVMKADDEEILVLTGRPTLGEAVRFVREQGVADVVITSGSRGATLHGPGRPLSLPAVPPRRVVDATGAGDTFLAAFMAGLAGGEDRNARAPFAAAAASLALEVHGAFRGDRDAVLERLADGARGPSERERTG